MSVPRRVASAPRRAALCASGRGEASGWEPEQRCHGDYLCLESAWSHVPCGAPGAVDGPAHKPEHVRPHLKDASERKERGPHPEGPRPGVPCPATWILDPGAGTRRATVRGGVGAVPAERSCQLTRAICSPAQTQGTPRRGSGKPSAAAGTAQRRPGGLCWSPCDSEPASGCTAAPRGETETLTDIRTPGSQRHPSEQAPRPPPDGRIDERGDTRPETVASRVTHPFSCLLCVTWRHDITTTSRGNP